MDLVFEGGYLAWMHYSNYDLGVHASTKRQKENGDTLQGVVQ
jgi:hypothetical protein